MIRIQQLKINIAYRKEQLEKKVLKMLHIKAGVKYSIKIVKRSVDARKKPELFLNFVVDVDLFDENAEKKIVKNLNKSDIIFVKETPYIFECNSNQEIKNAPVIVGSGPAGLFCALMLARSGFSPIVLERGAAVDERIKAVNRFWESGILEENVNVQFGEGGAGTFSDGKLNTLIKDTLGRGRFVLEEFVKAGANEEILYVNKPHIGTDELQKIVVNIRKEIISYGGSVRFNQKLTDLDIKNGKIRAVCVNNKEWIKTDNVILAIGHSARDTFEMIKSKNIIMQQKAFAVGVRIEHPQNMINLSQYGREHVKQLGAADYKLAAKDKSNRGVFTFCMCPGGYVVNASSEEGHLAVNGMSYAKRDSQNANSAILVTVDEKDFKSEDVLAGVDFQRKLEKNAYLAGSGKIPVQLYEDYVNKRISTAFKEFEPCMKGKYSFGDVRGIFPVEIGDVIERGIVRFDKKINGYARGDAIISGVESRSSSPVRIVRGEDFQSVNVKGLYPCGEGAGYAGGITSAAIDGIKVAEAIAKEYKLV